MRGDLPGFSRFLWGSTGRGQYNPIFPSCQFKVAIGTFFCKPCERKTLKQAVFLRVTLYARSLVYELTHSHSCPILHIHPGGHFIAQYYVRDVTVDGTGSAVEKPKKRVYKKKTYPKIKDEVLPPSEIEDESAVRPLTLGELKELRGY